MGKGTERARKKLFDKGVDVRPEKCPFCGDKKFTRDGKVRLITRWRCKVCGHGWIEPANRIEANLWAKAKDLRQRQAKRLREYRKEQVDEAQAEAGDEIILPGNDQAAPPVGDNLIEQGEAFLSDMNKQEEEDDEPECEGGGRGYYVRCPSCRGIFHETTEKYDPSKPVNGAMLRLIEPYRTQLNWYSFPENDSISYACCECPDCGSQYCSADGKLIDVIPKSEVDGNGRQDQ